MAINEWWSGQPEECYWVEITNRETLGENLFIPKLDRNDNETPSYTLVSYVRPGDVVFHWWTQGGIRPGIVGCSLVAASALTDSIDWQPHGKNVKGFSGSTNRPAWLAPLEEYQDLPNPVSLERARELEPDLLTIRDSLKAQFGATYFPFAFSKKQPLRTAQGYLQKLPAAVVNLVPELREAAALLKFGIAPPSENQLLGDEVDPSATYREGAVKQISVNAYERSGAARTACIQHYGTTCFVCDFDFETVYGSIGSGFIHVHHLVDLALGGGPTEIDGIRDLRPVCPNCHAMLHTAKPAHSISWLRDHVEHNRTPII
jgi:hypothetical protein